MDSANLALSPLYLHFEIGLYISTTFEEELKVEKKLHSSNDSPSIIAIAQYLIDADQCSRPLHDMTSQSQSIFDFAACL